MSVRIINNGANVIASLEGDIDHHNAAAMRDCIDGAIEGLRPKKLTLDFSAVSFMDSSGVGLVMGRYKNAARCGAEVELLGLSRSAERIMRMSGLEKLVSIERKGCL